MNLVTPDRNLGRALSAYAIAGHARLAATPLDQLALTLAFELGRAALRAVKRGASQGKSG
jgi:hypothetical protein